MKHPGRVAVLLILVVAACGGSSSSSGTTTTTTTTTTAPKGPPTASITLTGDARLAGDLATAAVSCQNPGFDGNAMTVTGSPPGQDPATGVFITMFLSAGRVFVRVSTGSGADFRVREFTGTGLTTFDAAKGAQIDSSLPETTDASANKGTLGAVTAVKGSVDCGNFDPGSATVKVSGDTADGAVNGVLSPVLISCTTNQQGTFVVARGIVAVGSTKGQFFVTTQPDGSLTIFEAVQSPAAQHQYKAPVGAGTATPQGSTIKGDAVEQNATPAHTIHVEGDAKCGSNGK